MLGYFAGGVAGEEHPVLTGDLARPDLIDLKHFGAAAATSGGVELYHLPGITPEAPTLAAAFGGARPPEPAVYGPAQRRAMYETLNSQGTRTDVDFVLLGCPHASVDKAAGYTSENQLDNSQEGWDAGLEINWAVTSAGTLDETAVMRKLQHLNINTLGIVWSRTPASYESITQVLAAMEVIGPDGKVALYNAAG